MRGYLAWTFVACGLLACGGSPAESSEDESGSSGESESTSSGDDTSGVETEWDYDTDIEWSPCPVYTNGEGNAAECANVEVPLDWGDTQGPRIELFVKRFGSGGNLDVWFLQGGPGGASNGMEGTAVATTDAVGGSRAYLIDHRGVGRSSRLGCSAESASSAGGIAVEAQEWQACMAEVEADYADALDHFTTSNAARDVVWLAGKTRGAAPVHIMGGSYGTFWAHRILQIEAGEIDAATLLGPTTPDFSFTHYDSNQDATGRAYLDACSADPFCSGKLGGDAQEATETLFAMLDAGHCPEIQNAGITREKLRVWFGFVMLWGFHERAVIPATVYRATRCDASDVAALSTLSPQVQDPLSVLLQDPLWGNVAGQHIRLSEMWEPPIPSLAEYEAEVQGNLFSFGRSAALIEADAWWPKYPEDIYANTWVETENPLLVIAGEFDPATTLADATQWSEHLPGDEQYFVDIPGGTHGFTSPMGAGGNCAFNIYLEFLQNPAGPITDCRPQIDPLNFDDPAGIAQTYFGTNDLWE